MLQRTQTQPTLVNSITSTIPKRIVKIEQPLTHEVEISFSAESVRDEADHLVERKASVDDKVRMTRRAHVRVHLLVHEPERNGLVAHQCLIVALGIGDVGLAPTSVRQLVHDVPHIPVLIGLLLQVLQCIAPKQCDEICNYNNFLSS